MKTKRIEELMAGMKSFGKESYHKSELLSEMFALQQEIVELTFNGERASTADLKIWDVERHLEQLNEDCGHAADEEICFDNLPVASTTSEICFLYFRSICSEYRFDGRKMIHISQYVEEE